MGNDRQSKKLLKIDPFGNRKMGEAAEDQDGSYMECNSWRNLNENDWNDRVNDDWIYRKQWTDRMEGKRTAVENEFYG